MGTLPIVMPSSKRAGHVLTTRWLPDVIFYVHQSEKKAYAAQYPDAEIETHDLDNLAVIRQSILDRWGDVMMVDDDLEHMIDLRTASGEGSRHVKGDLAHAIIQRLYEQACDLEVSLFGFNNFGHPAAFSPLQPYKLTGVIFGQAQGFRKDDNVFFAADVIGVGDYWVSLLNAYHNRIMLQDQQYYLAPRATFKLPGGSTKYRTLDRMRQSNRRLLEVFGTDVILPKKTSGLAAQQHAEQFSVRLPF